MVSSINKKKKYKNQSRLVALFCACVSLVALPASSTRDERSAHIGSRLCRIVATFAALAQGGTAFESISDSFETRNGRSSINICLDFLLPLGSFPIKKGATLEFRARNGESFCMCANSGGEPNQWSCKAFGAFDKTIEASQADLQYKTSLEVDQKESNLPSSSDKDTTPEPIPASVSANKFHNYSPEELHDYLDRNFFSSIMPKMPAQKLKPELIHPKLFFSISTRTLAQEPKPEIVYPKISGDEFIDLINEQGSHNNIEELMEAGIEATSSSSTGIAL